MKLYGFAFAPNPRELYTYMCEKGLDFEYVSVSIPAGEHRQPWFTRLNPMQGLPVLELDDGACLTESLAIIEYLEEVYPYPPMIGTAGLSTTIADCTLFAAFELARTGDVELDAAATNLHRWHASFSTRPSALAPST